ncbi:MAG: presqualene diphosphate synthase HpnD [Deltaproteobacteria bacterium]|nr:presqualene diphosphate synthase HpnD [Deltaproteobacteria bacterium]MBV8451550.1 presqualene diphosphate synthase HpnD [Deltaproteobacteria bacterium]
MHWAGGSSSEEKAWPEVTQGLTREGDYAHCAEVTRRASSNFYYAFMLLPRAQRRALYSVYAFCRFVDDVADGDGINNAAAILARWREELNNVFAGTPSRAISRALSENVRRFKIPRRYFEEVIDGVEMDLSQRRYTTFADLSLYCHRVASAVGLICIEIFGYRNQSARVYAERLGIAFQLTNIIRDVSEDAGRGRIYLPLEDLARFGVSEAEILNSVDSPRFCRLIEFEVQRARQYYREAEEALADEDRRSMLAAEGMRLIYASLLERIARAGYRVFGRRMSLSAPRKLYLVGRAWAGAHLWRTLN